MSTHKNTLALGAAVAIAMVSGSTNAQAQLSGSVSLDMNSHFISYGADVWGGGDDPRWTFNPSVGIDYAINDAWTFSTGFWLDVNSNASPHVETVETDIWAGISYTQDIVTYSATFQNWQYGGTSEEILDLAVAFDCILNPSLTWHKRLGSSNTAADTSMPPDGITDVGFEGSFLVLGLEHGFEPTPEFSISIPVSVGVALEKFHTTEDGYAFASIGLQGSYAVNDNVSINGGVTYYDTDAGVTGNADNSFFTYNLGVSYSF